MNFFNRQSEITRLKRLGSRPEGGLVVVWGRRRVGKTRLLLEWERNYDGLYLVGDQSSAPLQRAYVSEAVQKRFPGFAAVEYPTWDSLLTRLAKEAEAVGWKGPLIFDELPYFVATTPELPSLLQRWVDHDVRRAGLIVAFCGSSQRMMQGLVLNHAAPLYGRAQELLNLQPLGATYLHEAFPGTSFSGLIELYSILGGIPRYWELAHDYGVEDLNLLVDRMILDPQAPLFNEPDRLLHEEIPSAISLRPLLDSIGMGAHKPTEIAARAGMPATSLSKPLSRLREMNLVSRDISFGESEKSSKRALYKIQDPFMRLWFRVVAPHRSLLMESPQATRQALFQKFRSTLVAESWEELCRRCIPSLPVSGQKEVSNPWLPARRYWRGNEREWDIVAESLDKKRILLGECKWVEQEQDARDLDRVARQVLQKGLPSSIPFEGREVVYALFISKVRRGCPRKIMGMRILDARDVIRHSAC